MQKKTQVILIQDTAGTGSAVGLLVHWKKVANTSPSISCWALTSGSKMEKKMKKYSSQTLPVPALPRGFKIIGEMLQTWAHQWPAGPNPVTQEIKIKLKY
jgi:hypothetical protein